MLAFFGEQQLRLANDQHLIFQGANNHFEHQKHELAFVRGNVKLYLPISHPSLIQYSAINRFYPRMKFQFSRGVTLAIIELTALRLTRCAEDFFLA